MNPSRHNEPVGRGIRPTTPSQRLSVRTPNFAPDGRSRPAQTPVGTAVDRHLLARRKSYIGPRRGPSSHRPAVRNRPFADTLLSGPLGEQDWPHWPGHQLMPYNLPMARAGWRWRPSAVGYAALGLAGLVGLVGIVLLVWRVPPALYAYVPDPKDRAAAEALTRTGLIAGLAGLGALGSLAIATRTYRLTQQGQITDRYTKAIEQLGSDKLDVRLGGIYALERIAATRSGTIQRRWRCSAPSYESTAIPPRPLGLCSRSSQQPMCKRLSTCWAGCRSGPACPGVISLLLSGPRRASQGQSVRRRAHRDLPAGRCAL
jgi:hypothetical protein